MKRRYDYDVLRVLSMLSVIYLHVASGALRTLENKPLWHFSNAVTAFATAAVPLFFMMSGSLLLGGGRTEELGYLFKKRIPRVLVPLTVWSGLILGYQALRGDTAGALDALSRIIRTPVMTPYWFLYALIPIYLLSPLLKKMCDGLEERHWRYAVGLWLVCSIGLCTARSFAPAELKTFFTEHGTLNVHLVGGYLGFFLLGAWLERLEKTPPRWVLALAAAAAGGVIAVGTWWDTYAHGAYSERFTSYLGIFNVALSASVFLLAKACLRGREGKGRLLGVLSANSFCVYLAHAPAIMVFQKAWGILGYPSGPDSIPQQALFYLAVAASCVIGSVAVSSIPGVCWLFTGQRYAHSAASAGVQALFAKRAER